MAGKGALEAGQRPENQVEDPEGQRVENSALYLRNGGMEEGIGSNRKPGEDPEGEGDETSALCT